MIMSWGIKAVLEVISGCELCEWDFLVLGLAGVKKSEGAMSIKPFSILKRIVSCTFEFMCLQFNVVEHVREAPCISVSSCHKTLPFQPDVLSIPDMDPR